MPSDIYNAITNIKSEQTIQFVDWCPTVFKCGMSSSAPTVVPDSEIAKHNRAVSMISNSTAIADVFSPMCHKFDLMWSKHAFVHWFC